DEPGENAADLTEAEQDDVGALRLRDRSAADLGQLKGFVDLTLRPRRVLLRDDEGDVELRGALSDRDDVDAAARERREHPGRDARGSRHAQADDRDRGEAALDLDAVDLSTRDLPRERFPQAARGGVGLRLRHGKADRVL